MGVAAAEEEDEETRGIKVETGEPRSSSRKSGLLTSSSLCTLKESRNRGVIESIAGSKESLLE